MALRTYSFTDVNVIFGIIELEGFASGDTVVTVVADEDQFVKEVGAKGDIIRTQTNDSSCTITVSLQQTSPSNAELLTAFNADRESGAGVAPMIINNREANETLVINNAWITKYPDYNRGQNPNSQDWVFQGDFLTFTIVEV